MAYRDGRPGFDSCQWLLIFLYSTASRLVLGLPRLLSKGQGGGGGGYFPGVKLPVREADQSRPCSAEIKKGGAINPLPCIVMIKHRDSLYYTFHFEPIEKKRNSLQNLVCVFKRHFAFLAR
jgi:hypothetical protein